MKNPRQRLSIMVNNHIYSFAQSLKTGQVTTVVNKLELYAVDNHFHFSFGVPLTDPAKLPGKSAESALCKFYDQTDSGKLPGKKYRVSIT